MHMYYHHNPKECKECNLVSKSRQALLLDPRFSWLDQPWIGKEAPWCYEVLEGRRVTNYVAALALYFFC